VIAIVFACALIFGLGLVGSVLSMTTSSLRPERQRGRRFVFGTIDHRTILLSLGFGLVAAIVTGWPVSFAIAAVGSYGLPKLLRQTSSSVSIEKIEAIAAWTEMLQGTLAASAGLNQAVMATASLSPLPIRPATTALSGRLGAGMHPREALLRFGDDVGDPCADRVVCSLLLAVASRAQRLGDLLAALAESTRDEVALRLRIETSRASVRSGVRTVLVFSVSFAASLTLLARSYLAPFGTTGGQLILVLVGVLYASGLTLMVSLSRPPAPVRLLGSGVDGQ
jgi:tight adherence protein B